MTEKNWTLFIYFLKIKRKISIKRKTNPCKKSDLADFDPCWRGTEAAEASDSPHNGT